MDIVRLIINIALIVVGLFLILTVLKQSGKGSGMSGLTGESSSDTYFGKNKGKTSEARWVLATKISAIVVVALSITMVLIQGIK